MECHDPSPAAACRAFHVLFTANARTIKTGKSDWFNRVYVLRIHDGVDGLRDAGVGYPLAPASIYCSTTTFSNAVGVEFVLVVDRSGVVVFLRTFSNERVCTDRIRCVHFF